MLGTACDGPEADYLVLRTGCGRVEVALWGGFSGSAWLFDEATGTLIGSSKHLDTAFGTCLRYVYEFGEPFECEAITECALCPQSSFEGLFPACAP